MTDNERRRGRVRRRATGFSEPPTEVKRDENLRLLRAREGDGKDLILLAPIDPLAFPQLWNKHPRLPPPLPDDPNSSYNSSSTSISNSTMTIYPTAEETTMNHFSFSYGEFESAVHWRYTATVCLLLAMWVLYLVLPKGFRAHYCGAYPRRFIKTKAKVVVSDVSERAARAIDYMYAVDSHGYSVDASSTLTEGVSLPYPLTHSQGKSLQQKRQEARLQRLVRRQLLLQQLKEARHEGRQLFDSNDSWSQDRMLQRAPPISLSRTDSSSQNRAGNSGIRATRSTDESSPSRDSGIGTYRSADTSNLTRNSGGSGIGTRRSVNSSNRSMYSGGSGIGTTRSADTSNRSRYSSGGGSGIGTMRSADNSNRSMYSIGRSGIGEPRSVAEVSDPSMYSGRSGIGATRSLDTESRSTTPTDKYYGSNEPKEGTPPTTPPRSSTRPHTPETPPTPPSPKHPAVSRVPPDVIVSETMQRLQGRGIRLVAHGVHSLPKRVWIKLDLDAACVSWQTESLRKVPNPVTGLVKMTVMRGSLHRIPLPDVLYVDVGKRTNALSNKPGIQDSFCFSLLTQNGSLDLQTNSKLERDALVSCFCIILDEVHQGKDWRALYEESPATSTATGERGSSTGTGDMIDFSSEVVEV